MAVSQPRLSSSIDLSGLPPRVVAAVAQMTAVCHQQLGSERSPGAFEETERRVRESVHALGCEILGACAESRDDGAPRIERDGQSWFRVAPTPKTIMSSLGPVAYRRARYRTGASSTSLMPVDESLGLVNDYLTRPAAQLGLMMMGHCTAREAEEFFEQVGGMTPSVSTLQRLTVTMQERWERLGPEALAGIGEAEDIPQEAVTVSVSLDGVMVALRAGEDGRAEACWREAACGTVSFHDAEGERLKTIYLGRMPESGKLTLKAQLASEVAHIRRLRPEVGIVAVADGAADNWTFLEGLEPETEVIDFWHACEHLRVAADHAVAAHWFEKYREILRHDPPRRRQGDPGAVPPSRSRRTGGPARGREGAGLLPQASPSHALPRSEGGGHRHRLGRGRGRQQNARHTENEALRHALADRRRAGRSHVPGTAQVRPLRERVEGHDRRRPSTGKRQHQPELPTGAGCLNKIRGATTTTAMRDSHPLPIMPCRKIRNIEEMKFPMKSGGVI